MLTLAAVASNQRHPQIDVPRTAGHVEDGRLAPSWRVTELFRDANAGAADNEQ